MLEDPLRDGAGTYIGRRYVTLFGIVFIMWTSAAAITAVRRSHLRAERAASERSEQPAPAAAPK